MEKVWEGRFREKTEELVEEFTSSISFDRRLWSHDIRGSIAYCRALMKAGVISEEEGTRIIRALEEIGKEIEKGELEFSSRWEDIHMHVERRLMEKVGEEGGKLHTGRSRNDQVSLDIRLFLKEEMEEIEGLLRGLMASLVKKAEENLGAIMPGYTHLRKAQPVLFSHLFMAYYEMLRRDEGRLADCKKRVDVMPLGSGALGGNPYPVDREYLRELLGFSSISANSVDAVSDRDFIIEFLAASSILMMHLSRLAEDLILWSSPEFGFLRLPEAFCTGSSIMPQKANPDVLELVRGKTGRVYGALLSLLVTMKGLPLSYNRDLQEDKEPLFDAVDTLKATLKILSPLIEGITANEERMKEAASEDYSLATELADYLVGKGVPFRRAHRITGEIVRYAEERGKGLEELSLEEFRRFSPLIDEGVYRHLDLEHAVRRRSLPGGTAPERVKEAIKRAKGELGL